MEQLHQNLLINSKQDKIGHNLKFENLLQMTQGQKLKLLKQPVYPSQIKNNFRSLAKSQAKKENHSTIHLIKKNQIIQIIENVQINDQNNQQDQEFRVLKENISKSKSQRIKRKVPLTAQVFSSHRKSTSHFQTIKLKETQFNFFSVTGKQHSSYNILSKIINKRSPKNSTNGTNSQNNKYDTRELVQTMVKKSSLFNVQKDSCMTDAEVILKNLRKQRKDLIQSAATKVSIRKDKAESLVRKNSLFLLNFIRQKQKQLKYQRNKQEFNSHINHMSNMTNQINIKDVKRQFDNKRKIQKQKHDGQRIKYSESISKKKVLLITQPQKDQLKIQPW